MAGRPVGSITPHLWISGPDPRMRKVYCGYLYQRNQAIFRNEGWDDDFTYEVWLRCWNGLELERGKKKGYYYMSRIDREKPWSVNNTVIKCWGDDTFEENCAYHATVKVAMKATDYLKCQRSNT